MSQQDAQNTAMPEKMELTSLNIADHQKQKLKELFPEVFTEGNKIDFDQLKRTLGEMVDSGKERFGMQWAGKADCFKTIQQPSLATLVPCPEESIDFDTTENVFIEGDNLEVLKLLQKSYLGKIKMIYIDPPYNTGSDFIYPDNYSENLDTYLEYTGQIDGEGRKFSTNLDTDGRFHSKWMNMMYTRLFLAKNLLSEDGVIFISIGDDEVHHLKNLCNEVFGAENFINTIAVKMKNVAGASGGGEDKKLKKNTEYLHLYAKNTAVFEPFESVYNYVQIDELVQQYRDEDVSWKYTTALIYDGDKKYIGSTVDGEGNEIKIYQRDNYIIKSINQIIAEENISEAEAYIKYSSKIFQTAMPQSSIRPRVMEKVQELGMKSDFYSIEYVPRSGKNKGKIYEQFYKGDSFRLLAWLRDVSEEIDGILYKKEMQGALWDFASETKNLTKEGGVPFPNGKKPLALIERLLTMQPSSDFTVLDFFAGSGTTAHAAMSVNKKNRVNIKYICVQLPEPTFDVVNNQEKPKKDYESIYSLGYKTISDLSRDRIRRAATRIKAEVEANTDLLTEEKVQLDLGFRVFKLQKSNFSIWDSSFTTDADQIALQLEGHVDHISPEAEQQAILFELLIKAGLELTTPIDTLTLADKTVYSVQDKDKKTCICLEKQLTLEVMHAIADLEPSRVIVLDEGFQNNDQLKTNASLTLKSKGILDFRTV
jgi:adenine-specific DNA-methyltransferase